MNKIIKRTYFAYIIVILYSITSMIGTKQRAESQNFSDYTTAMTGDLSNGLASLVLSPPISTFFTIMEVVLLVFLFLIIHLIFKVSSNYKVFSILYILVVIVSLFIIGFSINSIIRDIAWGYYILCLSYFLMVLYCIFIMSHFYVIVKKKKEALSHS